MVGTDAGQLGVGLGHESLQLLLEQLVSGLGSGGLDRSPLGTAVLLGTLGTLLETAFPVLEATLTALGTIAALAEIALGAAVIFTLGLRLQTLDGQVDLTVFV